MQPREVALSRLAHLLKEQTDALLQGVLMGKDIEGEAAFKAAVRETGSIGAREEAMLRYISRLMAVKESLYKTVAWSVLKDVAGCLGGRHVHVEVGQYGLSYIHASSAAVAATPSQVATERQVNLAPRRE